MAMRQVSRPCGAFFLPLANSLPHVFLMSRAFRGINRRRPVLRGQKEKPKPNILVQFRFHLAQRRGFEPPDDSPPSRDFQSRSLSLSDISATTRFYSTRIFRKTQLFSADFPIFKEKFFGALLRFHGHGVFSSLRDPTPASRSPARPATTYCPSPRVAFPQDVIGAYHV